MNNSTHKQQRAERAREYGSLFTALVQAGISTDVIAAQYDMTRRMVMDVINVYRWIYTAGRSVASLPEASANSSVWQLPPYRSKYIGVWEEDGEFMAAISANGCYIETTHNNLPAAVAWYKVMEAISEITPNSLLNMLELSSGRIAFSEVA